jgi:TolB-like protein/tetratricopeptide (TPR) repeat protein
METGPTVFAFGRFEADEALQELRREGRPVELHTTPLRLLFYLLRNRDRVIPKQELLDHVWPEAAVSESALFSALKEIRHALGDTGSQQRAVETLRGRGYRLIAPVEERPAAVFVPDGAQARSEVLPTPPRSVAVLPFTDLSPRGDQEYFADGMTEELISTLSTIRELRVVSRTSAFAFKGKGDDIRQIGKQLNVGAVVEGSVRKAEGRLRVTAQLISAKDGYHLWSDTYDRDLGGIFVTQREIARAVADALQVQLLGSGGPLVAPPTEDEGAYELYLMGRYFFSRYTGESLRRSVTYLERALASDPGYALAHTGLADAYFGLWDTGSDRRPQVLEQASAAAQRALEIDPNLPEGHAALGSILLWGRWDWAGAEREFQRALELKPALGEVHMRRATLLAQLGRLDEALEAAEHGRALDPLSPIKNSVTGRLYYFARDHERAFELLARAIELGETVEARFYLMLTYLDAGRDEDWLRLYLQTGVPAELRRAVRESFEQGGSRAAVSTALDAAIAASGRPCTGVAGLAALWLAYLGEADRMFACLEEAVATRMSANYLKVEPLYQPYRSDPRFVAILAEQGVADPS